MLLETAARDTSRPEDERAKALQIMQWLGPSPDIELLLPLAVDPRPEVRRQATLLLGLHSDPAAMTRLIALLKSNDSVVQRLACEGLARHHQPVAWDALSPVLASKDRFTAWAARRVLETTPRNAWQHAVLTDDNPRVFLVGATALALVATDASTAQTILNRSLQFMQGFLSDADFVDLLRLQQLVLLRAELAPEAVPELRKVLAEEFPSSSATINRELIRLLAYLQVDWIIDRYVNELEQDWPSEDKLHLAMHLTFLRSGWTTPQKMAVFQYLSTSGEDGNSVPGYLQNAALMLGNQFTEPELILALQQGRQNPGSALAALLRLPHQLTPVQLAHVQTLDQQLKGEAGESIRRLRIAVVAILARDGSEPAQCYLREIYDADPTRRVEVALGMAEASAEDNWSYLVRSLPILDPDDARQMLVTLRQVRQWPTEAEPYRQVILVAERLENEGAAEAIALLEHWQGFAHRGEEIPWQVALQAWKGWFKDKYPDQPVPELTISDGNGKWDEQGLLKQLGRAEQEGLGSPDNGKAVFAKGQCASCHRFAGEGESMGPDLTGVSKRFLKREILDSMLYPSKVISDQYAGKTVYTTGGKVYSGIVAPGAANEIVVLQSNGQKARLSEDDVDEIEPSGVSAMPEGLLDRLTLEEIVDLFAYLMSDNDRLSRSLGPTTRK